MSDPDLSQEPTAASPSLPPGPPRPAVTREALLRVFALVGLAVSSALLVDYVRPPVFCADQGSGCDLVRHSRFAFPGGIPLPILGVGYFTLLLGASLAGQGPRVRRALAALGALGVLAGLAFVGIQGLVLRAWCQFCLVVDVSSLGAGALALSLRNDVAPEGSRAPPVGVGARLTVGAALLAAVVPLGWGLSRPVAAPPGPVAAEVVPEVILREQRPGVATIVEFVDFECPFCRRQQAVLSPLLQAYGPRVRLVRKNVPLGFHEHARDAARTACCADEQGRGDRVAELLFEASDLTPEGCARVAQEAGLDMEAYRACLASPRPDAVLERDRNDARAAGVSGLPTLWIGRERFEGLQTAEAVRESIDRALQGASSPAGTGGVGDGGGPQGPRGG